VNLLFGTRSQSVSTFPVTQETLKSSHVDRMTRLLAQAGKVGDPHGTNWLGRAQDFLNHGLLLDGFALLEARWGNPSYAGNRVAGAGPRLCALADVTGKRVLLWPERSLSDVILMLRFVPRLARLASAVVLALPPELKRLGASASVEAVITDGDTFEPVDLHCPLLSLPFHLRTRLPTIPGRAYLSARPDLIKPWHERLGRTSRLRVGLALGGEAGDDGGHVPAALLAPLLGRSGIEFHVLQKTIRAADAAVFQNLPNVHLHSVDLADLADTAALAAGMDLIISADTAEAHLAGAIGKPVWVLLGRAAHFAWMTDRQDTPWYPTARLFRQHTAGDWTSVAGMLRDAMWQRRPNIML
jgi:hypothetical protein